MLMGDDISLSDASRILNIKYESAKTVWTMFRKDRRVYREKQGRKSNRERQAADAEVDPLLSRFDEDSDTLKQRALARKFTVGRMQTAHHFQVKMLRLKKQHSKEEAKAAKVVSSGQLDYQRVLS